MWTQFMDMHSGGGLKEKWLHIYIEAAEKEAIVIFYNRFGHNPDRITCTCCGNDYSIHEGETFAEITAFERGCDYDDSTKGYIEGPSTKAYAFHKYRTVEEYSKDESILVITASNIKDSERTGEPPIQGYVWAD